MEPRLAHLLGLEQRTAVPTARICSAAGGCSSNGWPRTSRWCSSFEDLQWADSGLLDFIDYLLEWSAEFPIFILALGRTELLGARPAWTATIMLNALDEESMRDLLAGLVPGLPDALAAEIRARAEGIPLYAVETVRMLLDRGLVAQDGARYVVTGDVSDLEVPETLQALVASRLDNLDPVERTLLQDAAVIGQSFAPTMLSAVSERPIDEVTGILDGLVTKQVLVFIDDPRAAENGQYLFLQSLLRTVALSTLSRRDRKSRHLAVAAHLRDVWGAESTEIAEVLASHYVDAVDADPDAPDADEIRTRARQTLADAGRRAESLGAVREARRHFERAAELTEDLPTRAHLLSDAGRAAHHGGDLVEAERLLDAARDLFSAAGDDREAALTAGRTAAVLREAGRVDEAWELLTGAYEAIKDDADDETAAMLVQLRASLAQARGDRELSLELAERALTLADRGRFMSIVVPALMNKAIALAEYGRMSESTALIKEAIAIAQAQGLDDHAARGYFNLADSVMGEGRYEEARQLLAEGLELSRRRGDRQNERRLLAQDVIALVALGLWDEAIAVTDGLVGQAQDIWSAQALTMVPPVFAARGDVDALEHAITSIGGETGWASVDHLARLAAAILKRERGDAATSVEDALAVASSVLDVAEASVPDAFAEAAACAFAADRRDAVEALLSKVDSLTPSQLLPLLDAEACRARARIAWLNRDDERARQLFRRAIDLFRELATPFHLGRARLEYAEFLAETGGDDGEVAVLRDESAAAFVELGARPWLDRAIALGPTVVA